MAAEKRHIIQKQVLEVEMENPADAFQFRNRLGEVYHEKILPRLEELFDEYGNDLLIRMDELQIDVGNISSANWEEELAERSVGKIKQALLLQNPVRIIPSSNNEVISHARVIANAKETPVYTPDKFAEIFYFFLQHGRLPWFASPQLQLQAELTKWLGERSSFAISFKSFLQTASTTELERLLIQFDEKTLEKIIDAILSHHANIFWKDVLGSKENLLKYFQSIPVKSSSIRRLLYLPVFEWLAKQSETELSTYYVQHLIHKLQFETSLSIPKLYNKLISALSNKKILHGSRTPDKNSLLAAVIESQQTSPSSPELKSDDAVEKKEKQDIREEIFVQNAGVVLLHPFLQPFFQTIGLTNNKNEFVNEDAHMRAVLFTQYLTTGEQLFYEQHLMLNKILCGYRLEDPIITELEVADNEKLEADDLLTQVIQLWKKNNVQVNATIGGLRTSFLLRQGKLVQNNKDWKLQVEQKPYDMVLSSLPWGITIIKNKWMDGMLWVEWA